MIDLHTHILYGIDDGCQNIEESLLLLKKMYDVGFRKIILTPHYINNSEYNSSYKDNIKKLDHLKKELKKKKINIELYLGNEVYLDDKTLNLLKKKIIVPLNNTKYLLFELPLNNKLLNYLDFIYEIKYKGYIPVLAHPERYTYLQKDKKMYDLLIKEGVLFQGNLGSILGYYGKSSKKAFKYLMKKHYYYCLGTDIHSPKKTFVLNNLDKIIKKVCQYAKNDYYQELMNNGEKLFSEAIYENN